MAWNFKRYGGASDPIHKSHLNALTGDYGCPRQFKYEQDARVDRGEALEERQAVHGKAAAGTAAHEVIAAALTNVALRDHLLGGGRVSLDNVQVAFNREWSREVGPREVRWYDTDGHEYLAERVAMIAGLLNGLHVHVAEVLLVEPGFVAPLGKYWLSGHIDLVYRSKLSPGAVAFADWKTGDTKASNIELDQGWEAGVYSAALRFGVFLPRESAQLEHDAEAGVWVGRSGAIRHSSRYIVERETLERLLVELATVQQHKPEPEAREAAAAFARREALDVVRFDEFPARIHQVHLHDYLPYKKSGSKAVKRAEDLAWYGYEEPQRAHKYKAGDLRGPAWLPVALTEYDVPRLESRLRNVVNMIRMGLFIDQVGDRCVRCSHARDCLTSGYAPRGDQRDELERAMRAGGIGAAGTDLSTDD